MDTDYRTILIYESRR